MRAWIEPNDDETSILDIYVFENDELTFSSHSIHRPLPWKLELDDI